VATGGEAEIHGALGVPTNPPPLGASECLVTAGELSRAGVELRFPAGALTRRELDETFGAADVLPPVVSVGPACLRADRQAAG
jgi:hypothetical protein